MQRPGQDRALLELFHVCLSLGLQGRWQDTPAGTKQLDALRQRLAHLLGLVPSPGHDALPLSPRWQPVAAVRRGGRGWSLRLGAVLGCALAATGVYVGAQWSLARQVDGVFEKMHALELAGRASARSAPVAAGPALPGRLSAALADLVGSGTLAVRDEAHRSMIVLDADRLFDASTARLPDTPSPDLRRIADVLGPLGGRVLVTAHAVPDMPRPAHFASASQLADSWAGQVQRLLQQGRPATTVDAEGRAAPANAAAVAAGATAPRNRIEIVWFP